MTGLLVSNLLWSTAAMLLVLVVRRPFAALFGAGPAYALWLLPVLRLFAPPLPSWGVAIPPVILPQTVILVPEDTAAPMPLAGGPGQWVPMLLAIWAVGAAVFIGWQIWVYRRFLRAIEKDAHPLGSYDGAALIESGAVVGPVSFGLLDRRIVVPVDFETRYSPGERTLALEHEAVHHRRFDLWWNHLGLLVLAMHWFNPVAWIAFRAFRADQETACDAVVTAGADPDTRHDYARALVKSASRPGLIAACPLNHADQLKRRLRMMKHHRPGRLRMIGGLSAVALLAGAGLVVSAGSAVAQQTIATAPATPGKDAEGVYVLTQEQGGADASAPTKTRIFTMLEKPPEGAAPAGKEGDRVIKRFELHQDGKAGVAPLPGTPGLRSPEDLAGLTANCGDGQRTEFKEGDDKTRTQIVLCSKGDSTPAQRADTLQRARDRLAQNDQMKGEHRDHIVAELDKEIAKLRAQQ